MSAFGGIWLRRSRRHRPAPATPAPVPISVSLLGRTLPSSGGLRAGQGVGAALSASSPSVSSLRGTQSGQTTGALAGVTASTSRITATAQQPANPPVTSANRTYRHARPNLVQVVTFETNADVDDYIQQNGTYTGDTSRAIRDTDPAYLNPGFTGVMRICVPAGGGEPNLRSPPDWVSSGQAYTVGQAVRRITGSYDRIFSCLQNHTSGAVGTDPGATSSGGDTAYWDDWGGTNYNGNGTYYATAHSDDSIQYIRKLNRAWEPSGGPNSAAMRAEDRSGFGVGDEWWTMWVVRYDAFLARSQWIHNDYSTGAMKMGQICSAWRSNIGPGQQYWANGQSSGSPQIQNGSYNVVGSQVGPDSGLGVVYQGGVYNRHAGDVPKNVLARNVSYNTRIDPNLATDTTSIRNRKRYGNLYSYVSTIPSDGLPGLRMRNTDPISGAVFLPDIADQWVAFIFHHKMVSDGGSNSLAEGYIALPGQQAKRVVYGPAEDLHLYDTAADGLANPFAPAYGTPATMPNSLLPYSAFWFTMNNTARIENSNYQTPDQDSYARIQELVVATGPVGPIPPGRIEPITSCDDPRLCYGNPARQHGRTNYRKAIQPGELITISAAINGATIYDAIPDGWKTQGPPYDGRAVFNNGGFSGVANDFHNRQMFLLAPGGHSATINDCTLRFQGAGDYNRVGGWECIGGTTDAGVIASLGVGSGTIDPTTHAWRSLHTYDTNIVTPDGRLWRQGGSTNPTGSVQTDVSIFDPVRQTYAALGAAEVGTASSTNGTNSFYALDLGVIVFVQLQNARYMMYDPANNQVVRTWRALPNLTNADGSLAGSPLQCASEGNGSISYRPSDGSRPSFAFAIGPLANDSTGSQTADSQRRWPYFELRISPTDGRPEISAMRLLNPTQSDGAFNLIGSIRSVGGGALFPRLDDALLTNSNGIALHYDEERDYWWWAILHVGGGSSSTSAGRNPERGRMGRVRMGANPWDLVFSEDPRLTQTVGDWNGTTLNRSAVTPITTVGPSSGYTAYPNRAYGCIMSDKGQDALFILAGNCREPVFYLAKPA